MSLSYDTAGRLSKIDYQTSATADVTFTYTVDGRRKAMADGTGTTTWSFDPLGRTTNVSDGAGRSVGYGYDPAGRVTSLSYPGGQNVTLGYDDLGRLVSTVDPQAGTIGYTWDADGNLTGIATPNGVTTSRSYDVAGRLMSVDAKRGSARLAAFTYTRSGAGRMVSQTPDPAGSSIVDGYGLAEAYGYDRAGRAQNVNGAGWYGYSPGDDLTHRFLANSTYDGDGLRATATSNTAGTSNFTWDRIAGSVALLLGDGTTRYLYGPGDLPVAEITGTTVRYLHVDQAGSVRTVTNTSGTVAATATWDAYGVRLAASGTPSRLGWQGQYTDPDTGLVYLRARYYDPNTATFLTPDPLQDQTHTPYTYANNDPWNHTDPSGMCGEGLEFMGPVIPCPLLTDIQPPSLVVQSAYPRGCVDPHVCPPPARTVRRELTDCSLNPLERLGFGIPGARINPGYETWSSRNPIAADRYETEEAYRMQIRALEEQLQAAQKPKWGTGFWTAVSLGVVGAGVSVGCIVTACPVWIAVGGAGIAVSGVGWTVLSNGLGW